MNWFWINMPLAAMFFIAMTAIPLWLSFRRPDTGPNAVAATVPAPRSHAAARTAAAHSPAERVWVAQVSDARVRELAGATR